MTTFARLAKVIKGYTPPIGWIENAFAGLATAIKNVLPEVGTNDKGKYLHTNDSTGDLEWSEVEGLPAVGENDKGKYLHTNSSTGDLEWVTITPASGVSF